MLASAIVSGLLAGGGWVLWDAVSAGAVEWRAAFLFGLAFALGHISGEARGRRRAPPPPEESSPPGAGT
jgi:hypothetical protein